MTDSELRERKGELEGELEAALNRVSALRKQLNKVEARLFAKPRRGRPRDVRRLTFVGRLLRVRPHTSREIKDKLIAAGLLAYRASDQVLDGWMRKRPENFALLPGDSPRKWDFTESYREEMSRVVVVPPT